MKNSLILLALSGAVVAANGQDFLAGWDFTDGIAEDSVGNINPTRNVPGGVYQPNFTLFANSENWADDNATIYVDDSIASFDEAGHANFDDIIPGNGNPFGLFDAETVRYSEVGDNITATGTALSNGFGGVGIQTALQFQGRALGGFFSIGVNGTTGITGFDNFLIEFDVTGTDDYLGTYNVYVTDTAGNFGTAVDTFAVTTSDAAIDLNLGSISAGDFVVIELGSYGGSSADVGSVFFDNIALTGAPVPEPSALAGIFGIAALLVARRRA